MAASDLGPGVPSYKPVLDEESCQLSTITPTIHVTTNNQVLTASFITCCQQSNINNNEIASRGTL